MSFVILCIAVVLAGVSTLALCFTAMDHSERIEALEKKATARNDTNGGTKGQP